MQKNSLKKYGAASLAALVFPYIFGPKAYAKEIFNVNLDTQIYASERQASTNALNEQLFSGSDYSLGANLLFSLLFTACVYTLPILIYKYGIIKTTLDAKRARKVTIIWALISYVIMSFFMLVMTGNVAKAPTLILWSFINYKILSSGENSTLEGEAEADDKVAASDLDSIEKSDLLEDENTKPEQKNKVPEKDKSNDRKNETSTQTLSEFLVETLNDRLDAMRHNGEEYKKYENDSDYGLIPEKPVMFTSLEHQTAYLEKLTDLSGKDLSFERIGTTTTENIGGITDIYEMRYVDGTVYKTVYANFYSTKMSMRVPEGFCIKSDSKVSNKDNDKEEQIETLKKEKNDNLEGNTAIKGNNIPYIRCGKCGNKLTPDCHFCDICGMKLDSETSANNSEEKKNIIDEKSVKETLEKAVIYTSCSKCGNKLPVGSKFCDKCGEKLTTEEKKEEIEQEIKSIYCRKCGFKLPEDSLFCSKCGEKVILLKE